MAMAENLKATHVVDARVKGVVDKVVDVGDVVASIGEGVQAVSDKVSVVIGGAQTVFCWPSKLDSS